MVDNDNENYDYGADEVYAYDNDENDLQNSEITFLLQDEILTEREEKIKMTMNNFFLTHDEAITVLRYHSWSIDALNYTWYDDVENNKTKCGLNLSKGTVKLLAEKKVKPNSNKCLICNENRKDLLSSLDCGHQFCNDCWKQYLEEKLKDFHTVLTSRCPQYECTCIIGESLFYKYLEKESIIRFQKALIKDFTAKNNDIKVCSNPYCELSLKSYDHSARAIECRCGEVFCFKCNKPDHRPCSCYIAQKWDEISKESGEDFDWMRQNTKKCPHCGQRIERTFGCNVMKCSKTAGGCGNKFCYVCEKDFSYHTDGYACNEYMEEKLNKENANKVNPFEKRYNFYFERYINYIQAVKMTKNKLLPILDEKIELLIALRKMDLSQFNFIKESTIALMKGKQALANTYIFGYYFKESDAKKLFVFQQGLLERNADQLHQLLEQNEFNDLIEIATESGFDKSFNDLRNKVINFTSIIVKYQTALIESIEKTYTPMLDERLIELTSIY